MADQRTSDNKTGASYAEIGCTGLTRFGNYVYEEWLGELKGQSGAKKYTEMKDNDPTIGAFLFAIKMLIRQVDWTVVPGGTTVSDKAAQEFIETILDDMEFSWKDTIAEILSFLPYGYAYFEVVYKLRQGDDSKARYHSAYTDGKVGIRKLAIRSQTTVQEWEFDEDGNILGLWQQAPPSYKRVFIPMEKAILFRTEITKNNPEGRSLLRNCWRPYYFKKNIEEIEGIGVERDLAGLPVMEVPARIMAGNATPDEKATFVACQQVVQQIRRDEVEGLVVPSSVDSTGQPSGYKLSLLTSGGRRSFDTNAIIDRYDKRISMTVMADFILMGQSDVGSFALSSDKTKLFSYALVSILDIIEAALNKGMVTPLLKLNSFGKLTKPPKLKHGDIEIPDLGILGAFITACSGAGLIYPDVDLEAYVRKLASFPQRKDGAKTVPLVEDPNANTTTRNTNPNLQQNKQTNTSAYSNAKKVTNASMKKDESPIDMDVLKHALAVLETLSDDVRKEILYELQAEQALQSTQENSKVD
jgi:hypothetical protein